MKKEVLISASGQDDTGPQGVVVDNTHPELTIVQCGGHPCLVPSLWSLGAPSPRPGVNATTLIISLIIILSSVHGQNYIHMQFVIIVTQFVKRVIKFRFHNLISSRRLL